MTQYKGQTGGARKHWLFDPSRAEGISPIMEKLVHVDVYFDSDEDMETVLIKVLDRLLDELPEDMGNYKYEHNISCGLMCEIASQDIISKET